MGCTAACCAALTVCPSAAPYSIAIGLTARSERESEANRLWRWVTGREPVGSEIARLFVVIDVRVRRGAKVELLHV